MPKKSDFINAVMLDPSRLLESRHIYKQLIPLLADYGYNTIFWHFTDDQGCMLKFPSHPELASRNAYTVDEMTKLIELAERHGIQIIPELECFGHTGYITSKKKYAHLKDGAGTAYDAMTPFHKDSKQILSDLIADCAKIFKSPYIHVGMDEVGFGSHASSKRYLKKRKKWQAFADHSNWLHQAVKANGKQTMMWGDHLLGYTNMDGGIDYDSVNAGIADIIDKDIIICDWHYDDDVNNSSLAFLKQKGFRCIACPASMAFNSMLHPRKRNIDNIKTFSKHAHKKSNTHVIGMMNTVWCPFRYFTGCTLYSMAIGAEYQNNSFNDDFNKRFLKHTFGISGKRIEQAFQDLHDYMLDFRQHCELFSTSQDELTWGGREECNQRKQVLKRIIPIIINAADKVKKNREFFQDICSTLEILRDSLSRREQMIDIFDRTKQVKKEKHNKSLIRSNCSELQTLYKTASKQRKIAERRWRKTRFWDDPKRLGKHKRYQYRDSFIQRLYKHEDLIKDLLQKNQQLLAKS